MKNPATALSHSNLGKLVKLWENKADKALSKYVRVSTVKEYNGCPFCGGPVEHCFHFVTRKRRVVRWLLLNVTGSCKVCNKLERYFPDVSRAWFIKRYGAGVYLDLVRRAQREWVSRTKMSREEMEKSIRYLQAITKHYKEKLVALESSWQYGASVRIDKP